MSKGYCYYHPDRIAASRCEKCNHQICAAETNILRKRSYHGEHRYTERYEYCDRCYPEEKSAEDAKKAIGIVVFVVVLILMMVMVASFMNNQPEIPTNDNQPDNSPNTVVLNGNTYVEVGGGTYVPIDQYTNNTSETADNPVLLFPSTMVIILLSGIAIRHKRYLFFNKAN